MNAIRILIIGGTGFIGPFVVKELSELGHELALFNSGNNNSTTGPILTIIGDRQDLYRYRTDFKNFKPDVVIHMGAYTKNDADIILKTFKGITERIVIISSIDVYHAYGILLGIEDGFTQTPLNETSRLRQKLYPYGGDYEKILVENTILDCPFISCTILRLPMVYGPGDPSHRTYKYAKRIQDNRGAIILDEHFARWRSSRGYVENVAHAISLAAVNNKAMNKIYNVGDEQLHSEFEWVVNIANVAGWKGNIYRIPINQLPKELIYSSLNLEQDWVVDTSRIRQELNYSEPISFNKAIRRTIEWELDNPPNELHPKDFPRFYYDIENSFLLKYESAM